MLQQLIVFWISLVFKHFTFLFTIQFSFQHFCMHLTLVWKSRWCMQVIIIHTYLRNRPTLTRIKASGDLDLASKLSAYKSMESHLKLYTVYCSMKRSCFPASETTWVIKSNMQHPRTLILSEPNETQSHNFLSSLV